ncbi:transglutaminase domain-containing protein [Lysinibacillus sp. NPDC097287]|uniref:transglutaminase domain-containing protein n=1 Tax=Lysinibacillus sp. NPDC097287 TaxID=3364144 RepID=UPI0037F90FFD
MRKYLCIIMILLTFLQMSQLHVMASNYHEKYETANTVDELKHQIQQAVMQLKTDFDIRYTGSTVLTKDELTAMIKESVTDPYIYANIASFKWHYSGYVKNIVINFQFNYHHSKVEEAFVDHTLNNIIEPMRRLSNFEKVKAAHDFIVLFTEYSSQSINSQYSPYTLLTENKAVCQAYALVLYRMLEKLGLEVRYVTGDAKEQLHAWVLVNLDDAWYHIDVTWDDPVPDKANEVRYNYFLLSDEQLAKDHEWDRTQYPVANREYFSMGNDLNKSFVFNSLDLSGIENVYATNSGMPRLKKASINRTKFLAVVKNTVYKGSNSKDDKFSKIYAENMNAKFLIPNLSLILFFDSKKEYDLTSNQKYKSIYVPQQRISHKKLVVIKKGVSNFHHRDTLFSF